MVAGLGRIKAGFMLRFNALCVGRKGIWRHLLDVWNLIENWKVLTYRAGRFLMKGAVKVVGVDSETVGLGMAARSLDRPFLRAVYR